MHLGHKIKEIVEASGMTGSEIARRMGFSSQNFYQYYDKEHVRTEFLFKFCEVMEMSLGDFFGFEMQENLDYKKEYDFANEKIEHLTQVIEEKQATIDALLKSRE